MKVKRILAGVASGLMSVCSLVQAFPLSAESADTAYTANDGYTAGEIEAAEVKPYASLSKIVIPSSYAGTTQNVTLSLKGADKKWASASISVYYDKRLQLVKDVSGVPSFSKGAASQFLSAMLVKEDNDSEVLGNDWGGLTVTGTSTSNNGLDGDVVTIEFKVPENAMPGDVFPFDIAYKSTPNGHSMFTNTDNDEEGKLMQAYLFTKGIYDPVYNSNFSASGEDIARVPALANINSGFDGYIAIEDDPHLIVTADSAKQKTTVSWDSNSSGASLFIKVTDSKGNTVFSEDSSDKSASFDVSLTTGTYTAALTDFSNNVFDSFEFKIGDTGKWSYCSKLPTYITPDKADIQYRQTASKVSSTSPGEGWQRGTLVKSDYENSGSPYESDIELPTSETRQLLSYFYYHFCPSSGLNKANYTQTDYFTHWDALSADSVYVVQSGADEENPNYKYYYLKWNGTDSWAYCESGTTCDGSFGAHGPRSYVWYRRSTYQDKVLVNYYNYTKDTGTWTSAYDPSATLISYRFSETEPAVPETTTTPVTTKAAPPATTTAAPAPSTTKAVPVTTKAAPTTTKAVTTTAKPTTTAAPTTTAVPTTAAPKPAEDVRFVNGINNWSFGNWYQNFGDTYYINQTYYNKLMSGLSRAEQAEINDLLSSQWGGSCYGMATTAIANCYGIIDPAIYQSGASFLHDINKPPTKDVLSLINYYFALQETDEVSQCTIQALYYMTEQQKIEKLLNEVSTGKPTLLTFFFPGGGHAVVAYGIENGSFVKNGRAYNKRVIIYDNNAIDLNDDYCMYINTSNNSWVIPHYPADTLNDATLGVTTNDINLINYHGYYEGTSFKNSEKFSAVLTSKSIRSDFSIRKINMAANGSFTYSSDGDDDIKTFSSFTDGQEPADIKFALGDSTHGCIMKINEAQDANMSMRFEQDLIRVKNKNTKELVFAPSGYVSMKGERSGYTADIISNDGYSPTCWYDMSVSGEGAEVIFFKTENGYILRSDNLNDVTVAAVSDSTSPKCNFSTDKSEVFIYEIDEKTIGIAIDTDDDGTYETNVETRSASGSLGDVNADGFVDSSDASEILTIYAQVSTGGGNISDEIKAAADINGDGLVDSSDASLILEYYAYVSTGGTDPADVFFSKSA